MKSKSFKADDFMFFFRDDEKLNTLSADDRLEIFVEVLTGSSDLTKEILDEVLSNYNGGSEEQEIEVFDHKDTSKKFHPKELEKKYSNLRKPNNPDSLSDYEYIVSDKVGNDAGTLKFESQGIFIHVDNFPGQKKYFRQEIPIRTFKEFESDVKRAGLTLITD